MTSQPPTQKVLFMGLGASGKSSIRAVAFEGKSPIDVTDYRATINYTRSSKHIIDSAFQIFDCGGQESFISAFVGEQAEFIFSDVDLLIWVVDVSDFDQVSTSKFYFDQAVRRLDEYSPRAEIFCFFHKIDLILLNMKEQILETMKSYFVPNRGNFVVHYKGTSIFDQSIYSAVGEIVQGIIRKNTKAKTVSEAIQEFVEANKELSGIAVYTEEGLPVFEEGDLANLIVVPANLLLTSLDRLVTEFRSDTFKTTMETNDYLFIFQRIKSELLLTGVAHKIAPLQYMMVKMDQLAGLVEDLL
ncbi:MAG: ADP-ribosylation factor-like protein [Candidatus Thorarchaeota archaeon]